MDIGLLRAIFNVGLRSSARVVERSARNVITMDILHTNIKTKWVHKNLATLKALFYILLQKNHCKMF